MARFWQRIWWRADVLAKAVFGGPEAQGHRGGPRWVVFAARVAREFWRHRCPVRASALAYTTLLALVPLLAVSIAVASLIFDVKDPGRRQELMAGIERLVDNLAPTLGLSDAAGAERRAQVAQQILDFVGNIDFGKIGVTAAAGLIFVALSLLRTIEAAFNDIWGVTRGRGWFQSVVLYWAAITLGPLVLAVVKSLNFVRAYGAQFSWFQTGGPGHVLLRLSEVIPTLLLALAFAGLYRSMPNTRVRWSAALLGGGVAAGLWWLNNRAAMFYNSRVITYSTIYGSLGLLPLFLIGLYFSWLILLLGAETAYVYQHQEASLQNEAADRVDQASREFVALRLMVEIGRGFMAETATAETDGHSSRLGVPPRVAERILAALRRAGLIHEIIPPRGVLSLQGPRDRSAEPLHYLPAVPLDRITTADVLRAVRVSPGGTLMTREDAASEPVRAEFAAVMAAAESRGRAVTVADLVRQSFPSAPTNRVISAKGS